MKVLFRELEMDSKCKSGKTIGFQKLTHLKIQSDLKILDESEKVQELIESETNSWNAELIDDIFSLMKQKQLNEFH